MLKFLQLKKLIPVLLLIGFVACNHPSHLPLKVTSIETLSQKLIDSLIMESKSRYESNNQVNDLFDYYLREAEAIALTNKQFARQAEIYNEVAKRYRNISAFSKAIFYYQKSLDIANAINNDKVKAYTTHEMAVAFRRVDNNANALKLHMQVLDWAEAVHDTFLIHSSLNGIGNVYLSYNNMLEAISFFHRSLNYLGSNPRNLLGEAINTDNIGEGWLMLKRPDSALFYLKRSYEINTKLGSHLGQAICENGFGNVYLSLGDNEKAKQHFNESLKLNRQIGDLIYVADNLRNLGTTCLAMQDFRNGESYLKEAIIISEKIGSKAQVLEAAKSLGKYYAKINQADLALKYIEKSLIYKDSITQELSEQNTEAMNVLYRAEKQEREILILKQQAELNKLRIRTQYWTLGALAFLLFTGFVLVFFILRQRQLRNRFKELELEQKLFRSQLNPHFLFNSLAAVQNFIMNNDKMAACDYLANFSRLTRAILMGSKNELTPLNKELELLEDYLKLQQLRFQGKFQYQFEIKNDIDSEECLLPSMLIQPFVENAIEHGVRDIEYPGIIMIRFLKQDNDLLIEIEDNGRGLNLDGNAKKSGHISMATQITRQRMELLKLQSKKTCKFEIANKNANPDSSGVIVRIVLPFYYVEN